MSRGGISLAAAARQLGGSVASGGILCPGPNHSRKDRSLSVRFGAEFPDGFAVFSHAGDDAMLCRDHVRAALGFEAWRPSRPDQAPRPAIRVAPVRRHDDEDAQRTVRAVALWQEACPIDGTPADAYLASRGLSYNGAALRWHPSCPFGQGVRQGCMVALVRNIFTNEPQALHRTAFDGHARKIGRKALGPIGGGVIKLTPDEDVTLALGVAEGIETALALHVLAAGCVSLPVWACIPAGGVERFPTLPGVESYWLALDNDPAGEKATRALAARVTAAGSEAIIIRPNAPGADVADLGKARRHG